jgi:hypothetical protein
MSRFKGAKFTNQVTSTTTPIQLIAILPLFKLYLPSNEMRYYGKLVNGTWQTWEAVD